MWVPRRWPHLALRAFAMLCILALGAAESRGQLRLEQDRLARASPQLVEALKADPFNYFRFVNRPWIARVCEVFAADLPRIPVVRLHGDAHVEQFALTEHAWGLDDFDDSARGPALVDIVRFLGSIDLAVRGRGWTRDRDVLFDRFFEGYRRGLAEPDYEPPPPAIVRQMRSEPSRTRVAFLEWGETKMEPMADVSIKAVLAAMSAFADLMQRERPELTRDYFRVTRAGWLRTGVGSAVVSKILMRVQGPSPDPSDDELLEGKAVSSLEGLRCLDAHAASTPLRVIAGNQQLGRLKHNILAAGPDLVIPELVVHQELRNWWIRSWDPSYREVQVADLRSVQDLAAIVYDAGVQLGGGSIYEQPAEQRVSTSKRTLDVLVTLEKRLRTEAVNLVEDLLRGWQEIAKR
jgi:hypothetical protein